MPLKLTTYYRGSRIPELPGTNTFHSTELFRVYEATPGYEPILVVASEDGRPLAKLLGTVRKAVRLFPPGLIKRCEIYDTGEYFDEAADKESIFAEMLHRLTSVALRHAFLIEVRNLENPMFGYKVFRANRYFPINWLRVRNSLHSLTRVEERYSPSRVRHVRKGLKNGAVVREARSVQEIQEFARMLHRIYSSKIRRHFPSRDFFTHLEQQMLQGKNSKTFIVLCKERIIGGCVCIYSGETVYLWFSGGMRKRHPHLYPGVLPVWKAMEDAKERGFHHFEFMDVGLPFRQHGYRDFVLRFGGKEFGTRRWFRFRWNWLNGLLSRFYK
ncbi:MAG: GNAT family N-acetyltransferase [Bacteroides sp.]|nr:GNAT family N-acetyltransferase [Bacteroides sp.]